MILPPWDDKDQASYAVMYMASVLTVLADVTQFQDPGGTYDTYPDVLGLLNLFGGNADEAFLHFRDYFATYIRDSVEVIGFVGTYMDKNQRDWDMALISIINLIYGLADVWHQPSGGPGAPPEPALTNEMIHDLLCQKSDACLDLNRPYLSFKSIKDHLTIESSPSYKRPETENHVLNILAWDVLATAWVLWQGALPLDHPRYHPPIKSMRDDHLATWFAIDQDLRSEALDILGRVLHRGMFESNSKPYEGISLQAIVTLAAYADIAAVDQYFLPVKQAARNALHYLATKFAFQSLQGKRLPPMRRHEGKREALAMYRSNAVPFQLGLLSGSYAFDDCFDDWRARRPGS